MQRSEGAQTVAAFIPQIHLSCKNQPTCPGTGTGPCRPTAAPPLPPPALGHQPRRAESCLPGRSAHGSLRRAIAGFGDEDAVCPLYRLICGEKDMPFAHRKEP